MNKVRLAQEDVDWREVEGEVIALKRKSAAYLGVNRSGTLLWHALQAGADEDELAGVLVRHYGITSEAARLDVISFVDQLRAQGLVQPD